MRVAQVPSCDGYAVESPDGYLGRVEETRLDESLQLPVGPHVEPAMPGRPVWQIALFGLSCLAALICGEIALAFGVAYLVTGRFT